MSTCRACGAEIQFLVNKKGKLEPFDMEPASHFRSCKKRPQKIAVPSKPDSLVVEALMALGYKRRDAEAQVRKPESEEMRSLLSALSAAGREGA